MLVALTTILVAVLALEGCVLFTTPVNSPPTVMIYLESDPLAVRGAPITVAARISDPDGGNVTLAWSFAPGICTFPLDPSQRPATIYLSPPGDPTFKTPFPSNAPTTICVWVLATDPQGATALDALAVSSVNRKPTPVITVTRPTNKTSSGLYPLYSVFALSAASSSDPDGDTIRDPMFSVMSFPPAATPIPTLGNCPGQTPSPFLQCLDVGRFAGTYVVQLSVSDGMVPNTTTTTLVVDEDHPACVAKTDPDTATSPIVLDPGEAKTFAVTSILDDGAPWPTPSDGAPSRPTFAWKVRRNGGAWQAIAGYEDVNALALPAGAYASGDTVDVSTTISDGVAMHLQPACDPQCPAGCPQSAQWTVSYR